MRTIKAPLVDIPYEHKTVFLFADRHEVSRHHWEGYAEDGVGFSFDLESLLKHGEAFHLWNEKVYVLQQNPEKVFRVKYEGGREFSYVAWQAGNMHLAIQFLGDAFLIEDFPATRDLLHKHGVAYEELAEAVRLHPETQARAHQQHHDHRRHRHHKHGHPHAR